MKPLLHRQRLGKLGENLAVSFLKKHGYRIIQQNFKARYGEIDIICTKDDILVFVEVKTRTGESFGKPEDAVTPRKLNEIIQTIAYYIAKTNQSEKSQRIDVVAVVMDKQEKLISLDHLQNVTF